MLKEIKAYNFELNPLKVIEIQDGNMGSLYIINPNKNGKDRKMYKSIIQKEFYDVDNVPISVSLNIDTDGNLFELDIWRVDFNPIINFPKYSHKK